MKLQASHQTPNRPRRNAVSLLDTLRHAFLRQRAQARCDLALACAAAVTQSRFTESDCIDALMAGLPQALHHRPVILRPGTAQTSFDEDWLLRLFRSVQENDTNSVTFLLKSRVSAPHVRHVGYLVARAAMLR